jgi:hypothetical protein
MGGTAKTMHRIAGLLARDSNWLPAERWGSWALHERAGLQFALDPSLLRGSEVVLFGAFTFIGPMLGARLRLLVGDTVVGDERTIDSTNAVLEWPLPMTGLLRRATVSEDELLVVDLRFELIGVTSNMREASRAIDPRELTFGLKSFLMLGTDASAERMRIAKRNAPKFAS